MGESVAIELAAVLLGVIVVSQSKWVTLVPSSI